MKLNNIGDPNKEDALAMLGLTAKPRTTQTVLGSLGILGAGLLVGAGAALLLAPQSGRHLREDLGHRLRDLRERARAQLVSSSDHPVANVGIAIEDAIRP